MHRLLPSDYLITKSLHLEIGQTLDIATFRRELTSRGYRLVAQVIEHGDIAIRGSLIDIFPMGSQYPYRIDLFDDVIDSMRSFHPDTQRSLEKTELICVLPAREIAIVDEGIACFRSNWRARFEGNPNQCPVYRDVSQGLAPAGIEYYLPLFYRETNSLFDYLSDHCVIVLDDGMQEGAEKFWSDIEQRYEQGRHDIERPLLPPREMFLNSNDLFTAMKRFPQIYISNLGRETNTINYATTIPTNIPLDARAAEPLAVLKRFLSDFNGRVLVVAETIGRRETLLELFKHHGLQAIQELNWKSFLSGSSTFAITVAPLEQGAQVDSPCIAIISESQLLGERIMQRRLRKRRKQDVEAVVRNLTELTINAPVVHEEHGVGRFQGLITLEAGGVLGEFIALEYAQGDKLYVPVASLNLISRYTGVDPEHAPFHRLGSGQWQKARRRAAERVYDVAAELLELHARRASRPGYGFEIDDDAYRAFIQQFPFEETPGQLDAVEAMIVDMQENKPMDRLICGDAGFGKTEVAMRAAFIAVQNGKQVALLVPTTLLAQQHFQNFSDRFADWPVKIEMLSRFRTKKEQGVAIKGIADGIIDIVIGTHKLIQDDIKFSRLGLVIIDEEHRFGVRQKEKFKSLRAEVDVLTLTATPIPRTLNLALSDLRELSIIATPPSRRLAVKTFVREWNTVLLKEALLREIKRGGQVYFLHNEVKTIGKMAQELETLLPEARVRFAHGQMPEKELESVMLDFYHRRFNILVCTTIIEIGIDVPSANTIIINRADKFGLAQLYQLRGRVGRSHHRAYAYLIIPPRSAITEDAVKRLEAIESLEELGIGFTLATHDLEIRGAGEILGDDQSGQIHEVGFGLYMDLLERAVLAMKAGQQPELDRPLDHGVEINLHIPALIPEDFLPDVHTRLILYKRISSARNKEELIELQEEMIDRFGLLPEAVKNLFQVNELKLKANPLGIRKVDMGNKGGRLHFHENANIDPARIIQLIKTEPQIYKFDGQDKLRVLKKLPDVESRIQALYDLFVEISTRDAA
jgi:transcription-repair coupling factor (superfamily II helicase)